MKIQKNLGHPRDRRYGRKYHGGKNGHGKRE